MTYHEAKERAKKERDIWARRLLFDHLANPIAYLIVKTGHANPEAATVITCLFGCAAAMAFAFGHLILGAALFATFFLADSIDGRLNRMLDRDDTKRGLKDFAYDGQVCVLATIGLAIAGGPPIWLALLAWMSLHYLTMRYTSMVYRLKVQFGDRDVWMVTSLTNKNTTFDLYLWFLKKFRTYPHPSTGEAVLAIFVLGPILWVTTGNILWETGLIGLGCLFMFPEILGSVLIGRRIVENNTEV